MHILLHAGVDEQYAGMDNNHPIRTQLGDITSDKMYSFEGDLWRCSHMRRSQNKSIEND